MSQIISLDRNVRLIQVDVTTLDTPSIQEFTFSMGVSTNISSWSNRRISEKHTVNSMSDLE